jgi:hypothetical protein
VGGAEVHVPVPFPRAILGTFQGGEYTAGRGFDGKCHKFWAELEILLLGERGLD